MAVIVQKFGGTSVANIERILHVASLVKKELQKGNQVAVVVSAMAGTTNQLIEWAEVISKLDMKENWQEYDSIVSSGEQVTSGLLALALQKIGVDARSWLGWQLPIITDEIAGKAKIDQIKIDEITKDLNNNKVAVVAGFQGICNNRITTLGRGGSDTSAVALAAALNAERCDIYTDVDGIYTSDPRVVSKARKLKKVAYEEMLEMASAGAKVLQTRSVEVAQKFNVIVQVLSSFNDVEGTYLVNEEEVMERRHVTGIACDRDQLCITLKNIINKPGSAASIFEPMAIADINVDMIVQSMHNNWESNDLSFTVPRDNIDIVKNILEKQKKKLGIKNIDYNDNVSKVSVVGVGMKSHSGIAQKMFKVLADKGINILLITTSEIKISILIEEEYAELAVRTLHTAYGLDEA